jgi:hypothetical protein
MRIRKNPSEEDWPESRKSSRREPFEFLKSRISDQLLEEMDFDSDDNVY